jgi:hypothetical protein
MNETNACLDALDLSLRDLETAITAARTQIYLSKQLKLPPATEVPYVSEKLATEGPTLWEYTATGSLTRYIVDLMRILINCYPIYGPVLQEEIHQLWEELTQ